MPIGPGCIQIIKKGLRKGFLSAMLVGCGCFSADLVYIALAYFGLASFAKIALVRILMLLIGGIVLVYIGLRSAKKKIKIISTEQRSDYLSGFIMVGVSPFSALFWLSVIGSTMSSSAFPILVVLGIAIGMMTWFFILSSLCSLGKKYVSPRLLKFITMIGSVFIIGFGIRFLVLFIGEVISFL